MSRAARKPPRGPTPATPAPPAADGRVLPLLVAALAAGVMLPGLRGAWLWDDVWHVLENPRVASLSMASLGGTSRPLDQLTFAIGHAIVGYDAPAHRAFNIVVHALAALALFALVRRTLRREALRERFGAAAPALAAAVAALWAVHPLQTESVTYIVGRSESLSGLCVLASLLALARAADAARPAPWLAASVASALAGIATKPVAAVAPVLALLLDRAFFAGSFRGALARRGAYHGAMLASLALVPLLLAQGRADWGPSSGFGMRGVTPASYALTQPGVLAHYLRLVAWPDRLVLDYAWPLARGWRDALPGALVVLPVVAAGAWGVARNRAWGFALAWTAVLLAPTSSVMPLADAAFEHRMYLPLAGLVALGVLGAWRALAPRASVAPLGVACALALAALGARTVARQRDYASAVAMWRANVAAVPANARAWTQLGTAYAAEGRLDEAIGAFAEAVRRNPTYGPAVGNLAHALDAAGRIAPDEAARRYTEALRLDPALAGARADLALARARLGRLADAEAEARRALAQQPGLVAGRYALAVALALQGRRDEARAELRAVLAADPAHEDARRALAGLDAEANAPR